MNKLKGFTLIEIILVIALIGVTSTVIISLVNPPLQFKKADDAKRKADIRQLQAALELYRADQGQYPLPVSGAVRSCNGYFRYPDPGGVTYMQKVPCDPRTNAAYPYISDGITYTLIACLQNVRDPQRDLPPLFTGNNSTYCTGGTTNWSYTVTNP